MDVFDKKLIEQLEEKGKKEQDSDRIVDFENGNYILIPLPYYYKNNTGLGSFDYLSYTSHLATSHLETDKHRLFDVYFLVKGKSRIFSIDRDKDRKAIHKLIKI